MSQPYAAPHISKIYEALTAIADKRYELVSDTELKLFSSSRGKFYTVKYDPHTMQIMSNDNTAYYTHSISYPMLTLLMLRGDLPYDHSLLSPLSNIVWKDIMTKHKNDYDAGIKEVVTSLESQGINIDDLSSKIELIYNQACSLTLSPLGPRQLPPRAY
ncbi:hypothetical protein KBD69_00945 [Candidatus Woesebacteria bacterium]|nr:hypothetical protein [Candidatus Woesebacteria bacterium]